MKRTLRDDRRFATRRRGVTLVEMLVTLAVLLLLMVFLVKIFQAATGSLSAAQVYQELDNQLRLLDSTIRSDLTGVTCRMTPGVYDYNTGKVQGGNDPRHNPGYFEYGENEFADLQNEDSDDYFRFTAKAPAGRPFTGRMWVPPAIPLSQMSAAQQQNYLATQPITITSEFAEIIYFLRNGNLYRRVLLVAPERQASVAASVSGLSNGNLLNPWVYRDPANLTVTNHTFTPNSLASIAVSWQGMNDISAHPAPRGAAADALGNPTNSVVLNTLGDLTNRENRWAYQRFADDFYSLTTAAAGQDGLSDDVNGDNVPDYYPTLYPTVTPTNGPPLDQNGNAIPLLFEPVEPVRLPAAINAMTFPHVYPGAYSRPQSMNNLKAGWVHSPEPLVDVGGNAVAFDGPNANDALAYLQNLNHNPLDLGENLPAPSSGLGGFQTWWGFPTWRETMSPNWTDPTWQANINFFQPFGLGYQPGNVLVGNALQFLPDMTSTSGYRITPQLYNDGLPANTAPNPVPNGFYPFNAGNPPALWQLGWEDDLIMTGVRSLDVKAYDGAYKGYVDLGWGDDLRLYQPYNGLPNPAVGNPYIPPTAPPYVLSTTSTMLWPPLVLTAAPPGQLYNVLTDSFAHEGRMPPLRLDLRYDAQYGDPSYYLPYNSPYLPVNGGTYSGNVGDDNPIVFRLRRVWDSWSTAYMKTPATGIFHDPTNPSPANPLEGLPWGPDNSPPIYPSYPPPYLAPMRAIQIQIKVTDPTNQRIKTLTIQQDFTDKL